MVRAPCCEKMGLKKGPWTEDEDMILVSYIQRYGHGNWRALPKQAGLLRCGKSCRLRWTNYLRPDIKRGNFSREEEDMIINLHEMLGNRWSAIAARLPGRTDNEIKNVWHTHLKKRLQKSDHSVQESNPKVRPESETTQIESKSIKLFHPNSVESASNPTVLMQTNPIQSSSEDNSTGSIPSNWSSSEISGSDMGYIKNESMESSPREFMEIIDDRFWNEALAMDLAVVKGDHAPCNFNEKSNLNSLVYDEDVEFWLRTFMEAGEFHDLPEL